MTAVMLVLHDGDVLPNDHVLAFVNVYCCSCGELVHHCINEDMTRWWETDSGAVCVRCAGGVSTSSSPP